MTTRTTPQPATPVRHPAGLSKSRLIAWKQCPRRLWLEVNRPDLRQLDAAAQARFDLGHRVGQLARDLEPEGVLIGAEDDLAAALETTAQALDLLPDRPLFEPAFQHDGMLVRIDLLLPEDAAGSRHHLVEVKSTGSVKDYHLPDAAIQAWVARRAGLDVARVSLAHLDTAFVYPGGGDYRGLLHREDITDRIESHLAVVPDWIAQARLVLAHPEPDIAPGEQCTTPFECPFQAHCWPAPAEFPVALLPDHKGKKLARQLAAEGYEDLRQVPASRITDPLLARIHQATVSGQSYLDPQAAESLSALGWPRHYLDFETAGFAIPVWPGTRPFQAVPFQWSCHIETKDGTLDHREFLDTRGEPPMRDFAESLMEAMGESGPVFVYSHYEKRILNELAAAFPDLAPALRAVIDRLYDLYPLTHAHYYHPAMKGSWSIKAVLPTVAPDLDYAELGEVRDGQAAQTAYGVIFDPATPEERRQALARDLRDYCRLDTLAMVRLAGFLAGRGADPGP